MGATSTRRLRKKLRALRGRALRRTYPKGYNQSTWSSFVEWLRAFADLKAKARILARLRSATFGSFGDCQGVGEGVSEMRIHVGPGYRVSFVRSGATVYVLLTGGDKSRQKQDIARAKSMARPLKDIKL